MTLLGVSVGSAHPFLSHYLFCLDGGYFEVTKNAKKPFIVKTQLFNIQVLGTRFNVFAYAGKESKFETCLVEGRVLVYNKNNKNEKVYLNPLFRYSSLSKLEVDTTMRLFTNDTFSCWFR